MMEEKTLESNLLTATKAEVRPIILFLHGKFGFLLKKFPPCCRVGLISIFLFCLSPVFPLFSQNYLLNSSLNGTTQETCAGNFYDSGGSNGKYGHNENYTVTFCSGSTAGIQFNFSQFKLKNGDEMFIYDGPGVSAAQISGSPFSGSDSPETVISSGTCLTFKFVSNHSGNDHGWAAAIECVVNNQGNCPNGADADGDGFCEEDDCDDTNPDLPAPAGTPCDDGNAETSNDEIQEDGCTCAGTQSATVTGGECSGCDASMSVTFLGCDCVEVSACKDLSNVVIGTANGAEVKYENLNGKTASFCSPDGSAILTVWVKAGCYQSGEGPGYGRRFDNPLNCGQGGAPCSGTGGNLPTVSISGDEDVCQGGTAVLTASAAGGSSPFIFEWSNGLGTGNSKNVSPTSTTTYTVTVTNSDGCTASAQFTVNLNPAPAVTLSPDVSVCEGGSAVISATATGSAPFTYVWNNNLGNGENKTVSPAATTAYQVTVTDAHGCTATRQVTVTVLPLPVITAVPGVTICSGAGATVSATASGAGPFSFAWDNGLGAGSSHVVNPASTTTYTVTVTSANGCSATQPLTVAVNQTPQADAGPDVTICRNFSTTLSATATNGTAPFTFTWSDGLGSGTTKVVTPLTTKTYTVTVTSANGCISTDQVKVTVQTCLEICGNGIDDDGDGLADCEDPECGPTALLSQDRIICPGQSAVLLASATGGKGPLTYQWSHNLGTGTMKTVSPSSTTTYSVTVTSALSSCTSVAQTTITVAGCTEDCSNGIDDDGDGLIDCDDPDCEGITAPVLQNDEFTACPGLFFTENVTFNDGNLLQPQYSIYQQPANGMATIDGTGKFIYTPFGTACGTDVFLYQVCNGTTGCCSIASVTLEFGDTEPPVLINVPADITISCDDLVPKATPVLAFDQCPGIYTEFEETSNQHTTGSCASYQLTRTWKATDLCGNSATGQQVISVVDATAPELFRVYTLDNGAKLLAGVAQRVTHDWKYVPFPVSLDKVPVIFTLVNTSNDMAAVNVRQRNISSLGFEVRLWEEQAADGKHGPESVAWVAVEPGRQNGDFTFEAATLANVNHVIQTLSFAEDFGTPPAVISSIQTTQDADPVNLRHASLGSASLDLFLQEETSADAETNHLNETIGFMAIKNGAKLKDKNHHEFGEAGVLALTNAWATVHFEKKYTKPVVVFGGVSNNDPDPVNVRIRNVTATSFEVRLQEWNYLDGNHGAETVAWMVVEGSIPGNQGYYCSGPVSDLQTGVNVFSVDNCDTHVGLDFTEIKATQANGKITTRTWTTTDDCGNISAVTRFDTCQVAAIKAKVLLYGAVIGNGNGNGVMRDDLRKKKLVPAFEPFSKMPKFPHVNFDTPANNGNGNGTGKVTICHGVGTPSEQTLEVSVNALAAHLAHGDFEGACNGDNGTGFPPNIHTAAYKTIADGDWSNPAIWEGGEAPPTGNILFKEISITHHVTVHTASISLKNNSKLWVTNGSLTFAGGNFTVDKADVVLKNATLNMLPTAGDLKLTNVNAGLIVFDSEINLGKNFQATAGTRWLENVCLNVDGEYLTSLQARDTLMNVTGTFGEGFVNSTGGSVYFLNSRVRLLNGNFENKAGATVGGEGLLLLIENGNLTNLGNWTSEITQYCISNLVTIPPVFLPASEECTNIAGEFNPAGCSILQTPAGSGGSGQGYQSAGNTGILDTVLLDEGNEEAIVDWVLLELRNPEDEKKIVAYATGVVKSNGRIVSETGEETIVFPDAIEGNYLVAVRHRNHLSMMTDVPFYLTTMNTPEIDFTDLSLPVRGGNAAGRIHNGMRTLWPGDFNGDGKVVYQGPFNDVFYLFSRVIADSTNSNQLANFIIEGYDSHDLNMDGKVIYQGPQNDRSTLLYHAILGHPSNTSLLANFILSEKLP